MEEKLSLLYPSLDSDIIALVLAQVESFVLDYCNHHHFWNKYSFVL